MKKIVKNRPNIIMILADQFRGDCLGFLGNEEIKTPFLDELSLSSFNFKNAYSPCPVCQPARASIITGLEPYKTGFFNNDFSVDWDFDNTLMNQLREGGYQTINVGKNHFIPQRKSLGFEVNKIYENDNSNDEFKLPSDYHLWLEKESNGKVEDNIKKYENNNRVVVPWSSENRLHPTEWTLNEGINEIKRRDPSRPFYLQLSFHRPHPPFDPPNFYFDLYKNTEFEICKKGNWENIYVKSEKPTLELNPFEGKFKKDDLMIAKKGYYGSISHIDSMIGQLMIWLRRRKLLDNTIIIFTSDHGEMMGDHMMFRKGQPFEGSSKIPFMIRVPELVKKSGVIKDDLVSLIDLMPTILSFANIKPKSELDGIDLTNLLFNETSLVRSFLHGECYRKSMNRGWNYIVTNKYKYIWESYTNTELFFDLKKDEKELINLINNESYQKIINQFRINLINELNKRKEDNLVKNGTLNEGVILENYRVPIC